MRYAYGHNFNQVQWNRVAHHTLNAVVGIKGHRIYLGPQYSTISPVEAERPYPYDSNTFGGNFGYQYFFIPEARRLDFFAQLDFSIYRVTYYGHQLGPPYETSSKKLVVENVGSLGMDYRISNGLSVFAGAGVGSYSGFFLLLETFTPTAYAGLEYRF